jgi:hypothetical protein
MTCSILLTPTCSSIFAIQDNSNVLSVVRNSFVDTAHRHRLDHVFGRVSRIRFRVTAIPAPEGELRTSSKIDRVMCSTDAATSSVSPRRARVACHGRIL